MATEKRTGTTPGSDEARFPGYDVLGEQRRWDEVTSGTVVARLGYSEGLHFIEPELEPTFRALLDRLLAQDDEPRVPVAEMVDERLLARRGDGYRYNDMPEDWEAWRRSLRALDAAGRRRHGRPFGDLGRPEQMELVQLVKEEVVETAGMPPARVFSLWMRYACDAFYSHPWAWNEIGFGGPAYPRGYKNLGLDKREPWERPERDAHDPVPWVERAEAARRRHADRLPPAEDQR